MTYLTVGLYPNITYIRIASIGCISFQTGNPDAAYGPSDDCLEIYVSGKMQSFSGPQARPLFDRLREAMGAPLEPSEWITPKPCDAGKMIPSVNSVARAMAGQEAKQLAADFAAGKPDAVKTVFDSIAGMEREAIESGISDAMAKAAAKVSEDASPVGPSADPGPQSRKFYL